MKFSIIHPTARVTPNFTHVWWNAALSAFQGCDDSTQVEYILVVHHSRIMQFHEMSLQYADLRFGRFTVVTNYDRDCVVDQSNAGQIAASGEIILGNQDDMRYPEHWDTEIAKIIPDTSKLVAMQARTDGGRKDLLCIPTIATRTLMETIGLCSTEYESMYSDDEWSAKARQLGTVIQSSLYFQHL